MQPFPSPVTAQIGDALPDAIDPFALSLNENPFPPLPAVRSALIASIDAANRYPEFLPERLGSLIAGRIGVPDEQVVLGAGASGVVMQALHAVTEPGDRIVLTAPTFDGYPIFAQMAKLISVTVPLDLHGHHDLDAMADAASDARVVVLCRPHNPTGTLESAAEVERFLQRVPSDTVVLLDEAYIEFVAPKHDCPGARSVRGHVPHSQSAIVRKDDHVLPGHQAVAHADLAALLPPDDERAIAGQVRDHAESLDRRDFGFKFHGVHLA